MTQKWRGFEGFKVHDNPNNNCLIDGNGETPICHIMIWSHPTETTVENGCFRSRDRFRFGVGWGGMGMG